MNQKNFLSLFGLCLSSASAFTVVTGSVSEFTGPDDLFFDPGSSVIAVDLFGNADSSVNGVQFFTDRDGLGSAVTSEGVVSSGGVTVSTGLVNQIDGWTAAPAFVGGTAGSAANLSAIMSDIRWANNGAGQIIDVDIIGLDSNVNYNVQLLFNEGADRDRRFDIAINGLLAVDDMSSEGGDGLWGPNNSFAYSGDFNTGAGTSLNIALGAEPFPGDPNNTAPAGADSNAILQGIIIHEAASIPEPGSSALLGLSLFSLLLRRKRS